MKTKSLLITFAILIIALNSLAQLSGTITDSRDNKVYKTIKIGTQTWMAENLAYQASDGGWMYKDQSNLAYGYLYTWETAKNSCPLGWHLPSKAEWEILATYLGGIRSRR
jgi:uncharacterized protein (TIGR02145 family)